MTSSGEGISWGAMSNEDPERLAWNYARALDSGEEGICDQIERAVGVKIPTLSLSVQELQLFIGHALDTDNLALADEYGAQLAALQASAQQ